MADQFIGYLVSITSKNTYYQGIVSLIDLNKNLIQLKNGYKNGIQCLNSLIEIKNDEIDNIEIIADPEKAKDLLNLNKKTTAESNGNIVNNNLNPVRKTNGKSKSPRNHHHDHQQNNNNNNRNNRSSPKRNGNGDSENCFNPTNNQSDSINGEFDFEKNLALFDKQAFYQEMTQTNDPSLQPPGAAVTKQQQQPATNTTKTYSYQPLSLETLFPSLNVNNNNNNNICSTSSSSNLNTNQNTPLQNTYAFVTNKNYRFDEMVLDTGEPIQLSQIQLPIQHTKHYVTDDGLIIPCINNELKLRLFDESYKIGYTKQRQIECIARCCTEMALQLLGGPIRFQPKNNHQKPKVLVIANNEIQGAYAICAARLLSIRSVHVYVLINNINSIAAQIDSECVQAELKLLNSSEAKQIKSIDEVQNLAIDLIINAIDSSNDLTRNSQLWYRNLVKYCTTNKASVLSIDPSPDGGAINSKWSLVPILPQAMSSNCGRIYLCDLGFTKKVFDAVNIKYQSPFGAKFSIPLHND